MREKLSNKTRLSNRHKPAVRNANASVQFYGTHEQSAAEVKTFNHMMSTPSNKKSKSGRG